MCNRLLTLAFIIIALCVSNAHARIYKCIDSDGNTIYMDTPTSDQCAESEEVPEADLPPLIKSKPAAIPTNKGKITDRNNDQKSINDYDAVTITSPANEESIRSNEGQVLISYASSPALKFRNGHQYVITLGGAEVYRGTNTSVSLENVDRGTHVVMAKIVTANGRTLASSEPIEFTLHRHSRLQNRSRAVRPNPLPN
ncbi:MAG: DUF4124 domain-containing protein [Gammaproteobacteria bacterium]